MPDHNALDFSLLPPDLRPLAPLIEKYAASDDVERSELLAGAPTDELRRLGLATNSQWDAINAFLDENMAQIGPRQDIATALDAFSQAAMEAVGELKSRQS
jgi:hypothetical protein